MKEALYCKRKLIVIISIMMAFICMPCIALAEDSEPTEYGAGVSDTGMEQTPLEFFLDNTVGYHLDLVAKIIDGTGRMDIVGTRSQYHIGFFQQFPLETVDQMIEESFTQDVGMP